MGKISKSLTILSLARLKSKRYSLSDFAGRNAQWSNLHENLAISKENYICIYPFTQQCHFSESTPSILLKKLSYNLVVGSATYCKIMCNKKRRETTQMSINRRVNKLLYPHNGVLLTSCVKEWGRSHSPNWWRKIYSIYNIKN